MYITNQIAANVFWCITWLNPFGLRPTLILLQPEQRQMAGGAQEKNTLRTHGRWYKVRGSAIPTGHTFCVSSNIGPRVHSSSGDFSWFGLPFKKRHWLACPLASKCEQWNEILPTRLYDYQVTWKPLPPAICLSLCEHTAARRSYPHQQGHHNQTNTAALPMAWWFKFETLGRISGLVDWSDLPENTPLECLRLCNVQHPLAQNHNHWWYQCLCSK